MGKRLLLLTSTLILTLLLAVIAAPSTAQTGVLPLNQNVNGTLAPVQNSQEWSLTVEPNTTVSLNLTRTGGSAPLSLQMFNGFGNIVVNINTDTTGNASIPTLLLFEGGSYRVVLSGNFSATTDPVTYTISVTTAGTNTIPDTTNNTDTTIILPTPTAEPQSPALQLEIGQQYTGNFTNPADEARFAFLGIADNYVTFGMSAPEGSGVDPILQLRAPDGSIIAESDNYYGTPNSLVVHLRLPTTGVYEMIARNESETGTGEYFVAVGSDFILYDVERGQGAHNQPIIATLENMGVRDIWLIDMQAGEELTISVEDWGELTIDPMVEVLAPSGETLGFDDDGGGEKNAFLTGIRAPETGTYRVHIAAYDHGSAGTYRLLWRVDDRLPTPSPLPPTSTPVPTGTQPPTSTPNAVETAVPLIAELRGSQGWVTGNR